MLSILGIERYFRFQLLVERLNTIQGECAIIAESLYPEDCLELQHVTMAERALILAVKCLLDAQNAARVQCQQALLECQLKASVDSISSELIGEAPERLRARENGETA